MLVQSRHSMIQAINAHTFFLQHADWQVIADAAGAGRNEIFFFLQAG